MEKANAIPVAVLGLGLTMTTVVVSQVPATGSPGSPERVEVVEHRCPTFSWGSVAGAGQYELVVYALPDAEGSIEGAAPLLERSLPGSLTSWTPALGECLAPGGEYAWAVRAVGGEVEGVWSEARLFAVSRSPSPEEVAEALRVLQRFVAGTPEAAAGPRLVGETAVERELAAARADAEGRLERGLALPAVVAGTSAITGEMPDTAGVTVGVRGISNSPEGMGVMGESMAASGDTTGVRGRVASAAGSAGVFENTAGGDIVRGLSGGVEVFSVNGSGVISGDGSGLVNVDLTAGIGTVAVASGGTGATSASAARINLGAAPASHSHTESEITDLAHTVDTTCNGAKCDGSNFVNVTAAGIEWRNIGNRPAGLDDGDDDTTYTAGPGLALQGTVFSIGALDTFPMNNVTRTLDGAKVPAIVGRSSSITIGADGLGLVSYLDESAGLKVAHCRDFACTSTTNETIVDAAARADTSLAIGADGLGVIGYFAGGELRVAFCGDVLCRSAGAVTLGSADGNHTSLAIGSDGLPVISYDSSRGLEVAHCDDGRCRSRATAVVLFPEGEDNSLAIGVDGFPLISFYAAGELRIVHCNDVTCDPLQATHTVVGIGIGLPGDPVPENYGRYNSLTVGADGLGFISYFVAGAFFDDLYVTHCENIDCSSSRSNWLDTAGQVGQHTSVTIGSDGFPRISYHDLTGLALKVAHCRDVSCVFASTFTVDGGGDPTRSVGLDTSITIGADGRPLISYHDATNGTLEVAHCANRFCVPYFRRR